MEKVNDEGETEDSSNKRKAKVRENMARYRAKRKKLLATTKAAQKCSNKEKRLAKGKIKKVRQRANQTSQQKLIALAKDRVQKVRQRANQTSHQKLNARQVDKLRKQKRRKSMATRIKSKSGLKSREILEGSFIIPLLQDSDDSIGKMDMVCHFCAAQKFRNESSGLCCSNGKVLLKPFPRPPEAIMKRWKGTDTEDLLFKQHSREFNNALCLSSVVVKHRKFSGYNPSITFQGQMKHFSGPLLPDDGSKPVFAQLYTHDPHLETTQRFENMVLPAGVSSKQKATIKCILEELESEIKQVNPFVRDFLMIKEMPNVQEGKLVISASAKPVKEHSRRYNAPTGFSEVSILTTEDKHDIVIHKRGGGLQEVSGLNPKAMPLHFTLLFPHGTYGWDQTEKHTDDVRRVTAREWYCFHLFKRDNDNEDFLHDAGRLYQEFICMGWVETEGQRLLFQTLNQKQLRAECYKTLKEATEDRIRQAGGREDHLVGHTDDHQQILPVGRKILSASFTGGPRWYNKKLQDAIAILRKFSKPDLFITMTCNPGWPEILTNLGRGQRAEDRPDVVARVFKLKLDQLMKDIVQGQVFGMVAAHLHVIEWQKRGLPHGHILIILQEYDRHNTPEFFDSIICAELPPNPDDAETEAAKIQRKKLHDIVVKNMLHGPCGKDKPNAPCMENGKCSKKFPKQFLKQTVIDPAGHKVNYMRRSPLDGGRTIFHNGRNVDNSWVVPYNPYLSLRYDCHINVEAAASPKASLYLFKYVYKGNDRACVDPQVEGQPRDEIAEYVNMRSVSSGEAFWHLCGFPVTERYPAVQAMRVHLEDQQQVFFDKDAEEMALESGRDTELTAFFKFNMKHKDVPPTELPKYVDMPDLHVYDAQKKEWKKRLRGKNSVIGRVHSINPVSGDVYYLRLLLHDDHCRGKKSYADMLTLPNGDVCESFKEVCSMLGMLADDKEWEKALEEAGVTKFCPQIRQMFIMILMFCFPANPRALFDLFWIDWCEDFKYKAQRKGHALSDIQLRTLLLLDLELKLSSFEKLLTDFNLPKPTLEEIAQVEHVTCTQPAIIREELDYDFVDIKEKLEQTVPSLTEEQAAIYNTVMEAVRNEEPLQIFIAARGGGGKTHLINILLNSVRTLEEGGCVALAMATTGIAANLLQGGRTFHSRMKAPLTPDEDSMLTISAQSDLAKLIRMSKLLLIDEATMMDRFLLEAMDRTLRDLMGQPDLPFGGKIIVLSGDFRQCLPIVPGANRPGIVSHAINQSHLWSNFRVMELTVNMRVRASGDKQLEDFDNWMLSIGNGQIDDVTFPAEMINTVVTPNSKENPNSEGQAMEQFCDAIFPDLKHNIMDRSWIEGRAILAATNVEVNMINDLLSSRLPGSADVLRSSDQFDNDQDSLRFNVEYLNSRLPNGFPTHALHLKPGIPLVLLRNLDPKAGLCNGTKLIFERCLHNKVLECKIAGTNQNVLIPRIVFIPKAGEFTYGWSRLQFPVKPGFAMTINKSQGQTLKIVGLWLRSVPFTHGQLYVAVSRVGNPKTLKLAIMKDTTTGLPRTMKNTVFKEVLLSDV